MVDLKPVMDLGIEVLDSVVITVLVPAIGYFLMRKLHIDAQSALGQRVISVASNAAALGLSKAQSEADAAVGPIDIKNRAIQYGVDYLNKAISEKTLTAAKITAPLDSMVEAQLAKIQMAPPAAPAPAPPPVAVQQ